MSADAYHNKGDVEENQLPLSRLGLSPSEAIEQQSFPECRQSPRYRFNQCIEDVGTVVSWDELTGRK